VKEKIYRTRLGNINLLSDILLQHPTLSRAAP